MNLADPKARLMAKQLFLMRHAKSSWNDPRLDDQDRPLNERGKKAASLMGRLMKSEEIAFDLILCSTSVRTRDTLQRVLAKMDDHPPIQYLSELYHAPSEQLFQILRQIDNRANRVLVVGHNPGSEQFLATIASRDVHFPTGAIAWIEFAIENWNEASAETGTLKQQWCPRELEKD